MLLSVLIPSITGREDSLARAIASYRETLKGVAHEIIVVQDEPSWPAACNRGFERSSGGIVHFTADDLEALPGWFSEVRGVLDADELPAPKVFNHSADGEWDNRYDGHDGATTHFTRIPIMTRDQWERIGPWPEDLYYCADVWVSERGRKVGIETRMVHSYAFVHHWSQIGRVDSPDNIAYAENRMQELRVEGLQRWG